MIVTPANRLPTFGRLELIMKALEEDHMAIKAESVEAQIAHRVMADLLRKRADDMLVDAACKDD